MIQIEKESDDLYKEFRVYEKCIFCKVNSETWHRKTNTCICKDCAKIKSIEDLKLIKSR